MPLALALGLGAGSLVGDASAQDGVRPGRIGARAPEFALPSLDGEEHRLAALRGHVVVLEWISADSPYVIKHHTTRGTIPALVDELQERGVVWLSIATGRDADPERLADALEPMRIDHPVLLDRCGAVARSYGARMLPQVFVIDRQGVLRYSGAIDDDPSRWSVGPTNYLERALHAVLAGDEVQVPCTMAYGTAVDR